MKTVDIEVSIRGGKIYAPPVTVTDAKDTDIRWTITTPGKYAFPRDGIVIDPGNFSCPQNQAGGKTFTCKKIGHKKGKYKYTVNVNDGSQPLPPLDPFIHNQ